MQLNWFEQLQLVHSNPWKCAYFEPILKRNGPELDCPKSSPGPPRLDTKGPGPGPDAAVQVPES